VTSWSSAWTRRRYKSLGSCFGVPMRGRKPLLRMEGAGEIFGCDSCGVGALDGIAPQETW
jgi:hypothetical protein